MTDYSIAFIGSDWVVMDNHNDVALEAFLEYDAAEEFAEAWLVESGY